MCQRTSHRLHHFIFVKFLRFQRTFPRLLSKKGVPKNFTPTIPIYFGEVFEIPKDFLQKVLCVRVWWRTAPTDNALTKKARQCRAFLFCQNVLELRSKPPFLTFLIRKVSQRIFLKHTTSFQRKIQRHPFYPRRNKKATFVIL